MLEERIAVLYIIDCYEEHIEKYGPEVISKPWYDPRRLRRGSYHGFEITEGLYFQYAPNDKAVNNCFIYRTNQ